MTIRGGGHLIARIHQIGERIFSRMLKKQGIISLNPAQGRIMFVLWRQDRIPIRLLAERTSLKKSTLTLMLDRLERTGLVRRVPSPDDRRQIYIERTERDRSFQKSYEEVSRRMTELFYKHFQEREIDESEAYLNRILQNLMEFETGMFDRRGQ